MKDSAEKIRRTGLLHGKAAYACGLVRKVLRFARETVFPFKYWESRNHLFECYAPKMLFLFDVGSWEYYAKILKENSSGKEIVYQADRVCGHLFDLLGSGEIFLGRKIDWHSDFKSGTRWSKKYFYRLLREDIGNRNYLLNNSDVKVPWELSRFQHLPLLGQAFWVTGNYNYLEEFKREVSDWMGENSPGIGINWCSPMDTAIRAVNWIAAYYYFVKGINPDTGFRVKFFNHLYASGRFINRYLEHNVSMHGNNHYLAELAGLVWLGLFFSEKGPEPLKWLRKGVNGLIREMGYQVYAEGTHFEGSLAYHRLVSEIFLSTTILAEKNGFKFPEEYKSKLERMCRFTAAYTKPDGTAPQIGDADDGRFHIFSGYGTWKKNGHRHILAVAGEYFNSDELKIAAGGEIMDSVWINGKFTPAALAEQSTVVREYSRAGYYILKDSDLYMLIKCGSVGQKGNGGHDHNDQLGFELNIYGKDFVVDPGSYVYTMDKDLRQLFRSTAYHNVSQAGSLEQNIIRNDSLGDIFSMHSRNCGICSRFEFAGSEMLFEGRVEIGTSRIMYYRRITADLAAKTITIEDSFKSRGKEKTHATGRLHLAKDVCCSIGGRGEAILKKDGVEVAVRTDENLELSDGYISAGYGIKTGACVLSWRYRDKNIMTIKY